MLVIVHNRYYGSQYTTSYAMQFAGPTMQSFRFLLLVYGNHIGRESFHVHFVENLQQLTAHYTLVDYCLNWILIKRKHSRKRYGNRPQSSLLSCCWTFSTNMVNDFSCMACCLIHNDRVPHPSFHSFDAYCLETVINASLRWFQ